MKFKHMSFYIWYDLIRLECASPSFINIFLGAPFVLLFACTHLPLIKCLSLSDPGLTQAYELPTLHTRLALTQTTSGL